MKSNKKYYDNFKNEESILLLKYFEDLKNAIKLTKNETKLFIEDFEKVIMYYYNNGLSVKEILNLLDIRNLGNIYKEENSNWYPLDRAAKIYPLSMKENWMSVFRLSYYLKKDIVPEVFQIALTFTMKRFPTYRTSIRKGFFWHYIEGIKKRYHVYEDNKLPCSYINVSTIGKQSFKAVYYKNRISVEFFHILTDGYGGLVFISTLITEYLKLLGENVDYNEIFLNIKDKCINEESKDEFTKQSKTKKSKSLAESKALELDGKLSNIRPCQILHFDINKNDALKLSKEKNVTLTELMLGFIFLASSFSTSKDGYIKVQVPINMRKYYKSKTLRNFSLYVSINIKKSEINNFDELLREIHKQMKEKNTENNLKETITYTNKLVNSIKWIPLFIKKPIASIVYGYLGDKAMTTVLSNLGEVNVPNSLKTHIEKMDFTLGTGITNKVLFSMITCNDILTLTLSKYTLNSSVENTIYGLMKEYKLNPKIYGSDIYEVKK